MLKRVLVAISLLILTSVAFASTAQKLGTVSGNTYQNSFFAFKMQVPKHWQVASQKQMEQLTKAGEKIMRQKLKKDDLAQKPNLIKKLYLFQASNKPIGMSDNNVIRIVALNLGAFGSGIKSGKQYLQVASYGLRKVLGQKAKIQKLPDVMLGGQKFSQLLITIKVMNTPVHERWYAAMVKNYILHIQTIYTSAKGQRKLDKIIKGIRFKK